MREILFRGMRLEKSVWDEEPWVYGSLIDSGNHEQVAIYPWLNGASSMSVRQLVYNRMVGVDYRTVGQYTGLTDKNGKRIFEGDIVECWSEGVCARGTVQQRKDGLWIIYPSWQKHIMWSLCPDDLSHTTVEIIGNIHDNPELVEVTGNDNRTMS